MPAEVYRILGQVAPNSTTETALYTVPSSAWAVISTITVCNRGSTATTFRISVSFEGNATANKDYITYDAVIDANDTISFTLGLTLSEDDVIRVYAGNANLSFNAYGSEIYSYYEYFYM